MNGLKIYLFFACILSLTLYHCKSRKTLFTALSPEQTKVNFINEVVESDSFNINQYLYAYNGGGVALGDVNNDGLVDIYLGANQTANHLYINQGDFVFEDVSEKAGVRGWTGSRYWTSGVSMADVNNDGWLDIYVNQVANLSHLQGHNLLFINNQDGTFSECSHRYGLDFQTFAQQTVFFDYDLDGDLDAYLLNHSLHELDVYVKTENRNRRDTLAGDRLLRNEEGYFRDASDEAGVYGGAAGYGLAVGIADLDNNGYPDIYVSNDFHENDYLYFNQGDGTFRESVQSAIPYCSTFSMGSDIADLNNDGWLDIATLDMKPEDEIVRKRSSGADPYDVYNYKLSFGFHEQYPRNMFHINQGCIRKEPLRFEEIAQQAGLDATDWSWSILLADLDNDRNKDVYITNGIYRRPNDLDYINYAFHEGRQKKIPSLELVAMAPDGQASNYAFRNLGKLQFKDASENWGLSRQGYSMGSGYADLDNDGDLDLVVNNLNAPCSIYRNNTEKLNSNHYLKIRLEGPDQNRFGIGTRIELFLAGQQLIQEVHPVRGWLSSSDYNLIFGLGDQSSVDSLIVRWPDGKLQCSRSIPANQIRTFSYREALQNERPPIPVSTLLEPVTDSVGLHFRHFENEFVDFDYELLLPHKLSREGPRLAVGDLNGDQADDFFIGGATGQAGTIFFGNPQEAFFSEWIPEVFKQDKEMEDIEAALFDADQDGDLDIYVLSGGGRYNGAESADRLYLNDGSGDFSKSADFPIVTGNGSCVVAADFNKDGLIDLFIGNRSVVGAYGLLPDAYLIWNRGGGRFELDTSNYSAPLKSLGMTTDATWDEQSRRLWVVGEFMSVTTFEFQEQGLIKKTLARSSGWWNTIYAADVDQDGDLDFLVGNNGLNSPLRPSPTEPVRLLVKDWDNNGQTDPLLTYYRQGKEWLFHGLDAVKKQIPVIRTRFNDYHLYAEHTLDQTFSEADLSSANILMAETFESAIIINRGDSRYSLTPLPAEAQTAPIYAFFADDLDGDDLTDILAMGNTSANTPAIGAQKASQGYYLRALGDGQFQSVPRRQSGLQILGDVRDIRSVKVQNDRWILAAKNNGALEIWRRNDPEL